MYVCEYLHINVYVHVCAWRKIHKTAYKGIRMHYLENGSGVTAGKSEGCSQIKGRRKKGKTIKYVIILPHFHMCMYEI